jgi:hypothetical protein
MGKIIYRVEPTSNFHKVTLEMEFDTETFTLEKAKEVNDTALFLLADLVEKNKIEKPTVKPSYAASSTTNFPKPPAIDKREYVAINVPYDNKDEAKALGAIFDPSVKT